MLVIQHFLDIVDTLNQLVARIPQQLDILQTEEATKNALVLPVINALGYNVFDPTEVIPEFTADVGKKKGEKVDYVIVRDGVPAILIECKSVNSKLHIKHASQLFRYFTTVEARFAILTNGVNYQFFTDIEKPNIMDEKPFFEFSMMDLDQKIVDELKKFTKSNFNLENILSNASELKYRRQIQAIFDQELEAPSEEFVRFFAKKVYSSTITSAVREQFTKLVRLALKEDIKRRVNQRIQSALDSDGVTQAEVVEANVEESNENPDIVTTEEETEGYHIVKAILAGHTDASRVVMRDTKSYCGVLLDDNNRKPICRLHFNRTQKHIGLFGPDKNEERIAIEQPSDLYKYADRLIATLISYE